MKILAFTDIHGSLTALKRIEQKIKKDKPDILVCTGDISIFEHGILGILKRLDKLNKKIIMVHGNHEDEETFKMYSSKCKNLVYIHKNFHVENDVLFLGYGGDGFSIVDKEFEKLRGKFDKIISKNEDKKIVLLTHAPPYKTRLDKLVQGPCGNKSIRNFIEKNKIDFHFCGHLHENFGKEDRIKKTRTINPGPFGKIVVI